MGKKELKYKASMDRSQLADYLRNLADSLVAGTICVEKGDEQVVLCPTENVRVEIEAEEKKDKYKFSLELEWFSESQDQPGEDLKISATVPPDAKGKKKGKKDDDEKSSDKQYKILKEKMKTAYKEIQEYQKRTEMPPIELVEVFTADCQEMTTFPGKGDEFYDRFNSQAYDVLGAAQSGDTDAFFAGFDALVQMKDDCHKLYKPK